MKRPSSVDKIEDSGQFNSHLLLCLLLSILVREFIEGILAFLNSKLWSHKSFYDCFVSGRLTNISKDAVGRLIKRVKSRSLRGLNKVDDSYLQKCDSESSSSSMVSSVSKWALFLFCIGSPWK